MFGCIKKVTCWIRTAVPLDSRNVYIVFGIILTATALDNINSAAALTLATSIQSSFDTTSSISSWMLSGYTLTLGSFLMITGKIADVIGPDNVFLIGVSIVWICSLICACIPKSSSIIVLIVFRALQGIGASALIPATTALAANYFTGKKAKHLKIAVVLFVLVLTASAGFGVLLGGVFAETSIGYQSFFYFTFAIALVCDVLLFFLIIPIKKTKQHAKLKFSNINFVSAALVIIGVLLIIVGLIEGGSDWRKPSAYVPLVVGVFTFLASFFYESFFIRRFQKLHANEDPESNWRLRIDLLFPPEILKIPNFLPFLIVYGIYNATYAMMISVGAQYYTFVEHDIPVTAALKVFPLTIGLVFGTVIHREWYYKKVGLRNMFILSSSITLGTCIWYSRTDYSIHNSYWKFGFASLFLYGYGIDLFFNVYMTTVVVSTPLHLQGTVSGIFQTDSQVMLSIGNALVPSVVGNIGFAYGNIEKHHLHNKFRVMFYVIMGFHVVCFFTMVIFVRNPKIKNDTNAILEENDEFTDQIDDDVDKEVQIGCTASDFINDDCKKPDLTTSVKNEI